MGNRSEKEENGQWQMRLSFAETMRPIESSVMAIAAAPHHHYNADIKPVIPNRLQALSHIQRQKKSLMLLKCTVVSTATLLFKKINLTLMVISDADHDDETMFCTETMQLSCFFLNTEEKFAICYAGKGGGAQNATAIHQL